MATQEDRSLSGGMFIPGWMKSKMNNKLDIATTAYSPTELDDSFMIYYRNTRSTTNEIISNNNSTTTATSTIKTSNLIENNTPSAFNNKPNYSKHTLPCQKFLENGNDSSMPQHVTFPTSNSTTKVKSSGIDDGFKGEAAKCGSSVIRVAHQIVSGKLTRGFNMIKGDCPDDQQKPDDLPPPGFNPSLRRGSKSLPASPLSSPSTSPKTKRRVNKYFTGPFMDTDKHHGWILSNLLSQRKAESQSVEVIAEEDSDMMKRAQSTISVDEVDHKKQQPKKKEFVAKPSELREMNFWSPTSM